MVKLNFKRTTGIILAAALTGSLITGCGDINPDSTVLKVGDEKVSLGVANFAARYQQSLYESYYGLSEDSWSQNVDEEETTYEDTVKDSIMESLESMVLERQNASTYKVELTKADKKAITKAAKKFLKANTEESLDVVSGDQETVEEYLELLTYQSKVEAEIKDTVSIKDIKDKEARQKKMQYVYFAFSSTDENGEVTLFSDDEKKAVKKEAKAFVSEAAGQDDFEAFAKEKGYTAETATFDSDSTDPDSAVIKAADKLKKGETSELIEGENGYYVARVVSLNDKEATKEKKQELLSEKQSDAVEKAIKKWKKKTTIKVYDSQWDKVDFEKQGVTIKTEETDDGE